MSNLFQKLQFCGFFLSKFSFRDGIPVGIGANSYFFPDTIYRSSEGENVSVPNRESSSPIYEEQRGQPCHLSSSLYYGGQDIYSHPQNTQSSSYPTVSACYDKLVLHYFMHVERVQRAWHNYYYASKAISVKSITVMLASTRFAWKHHTYWGPFELENDSQTRNLLTLIKCLRLVRSIKMAEKMIQGVLQGEIGGKVGSYLTCI